MGALTLWVASLVRRTGEIVDQSRFAAWFFQVHVIGNVNIVTFHLTFVIALTRPALVATLVVVHGL